MSKKPTSIDRLHAALTRQPTPLELIVAQNEARRLRDALDKIFNAANADPHPIHYKVRVAIEEARTVIADLEEQKLAREENKE